MKKLIIALAFLVAVPLAHAGWDVQPELSACYVQQTTLDAYLQWYHQVRDRRKELLSKIAAFHPELQHDFAALFQAIPGARLDKAEAKKMLSNEEGIVEYLSGLSVVQIEGLIEQVNADHGAYSDDERKALVHLLKEFQPLAFAHEQELADSVLPLAEGVAEAMILQAQLDDLKAIQADLIASMKS